MEMGIKSVGWALGQNVESTCYLLVTFARPSSSFFRISVFLTPNGLLAHFLCYCPRFFYL